MSATRRYLLLATVIFMPLAYAPNLLVDVFNMPKLTLLFVAVCVIASLRVAEWLLGSEVARPLLLLAPATAMAAAFLASWLVSDYRDWAVLGLFARYGGLLPYLATIAFALLLSEALRGRARHVVVALVVGASAVALIALGQMLFSGADIGRTSPSAYVTSTVGHSNFLGGYLAVMLPLAVTLWLQEGWIARLGMGATIFIGAGLLFSQSQGGWLAAFGAIALLVGDRNSARSQAARRTGAGLAVLAAIAACGSVLATLLVPHAIARLPQFLSTTVSRGFLWVQSVRAAADQPFLGLGPNVVAIEGPLHRTVEDALLQGFVKGDDPHSVPLAMFSNLGVVGLAAFVFALVWATRRIGRFDHDSALLSGLKAALAAYIIQALISIDEMTLRFSFWVILGTIAVLGTTRAEALRTRPRSTVRAGAAFLVIATGVGLATASVRWLFLADLHMKRGFELAENDRAAPAQEAFERGLALRKENEYRRIAGASLAYLAFDRGLEGKELMTTAQQLLSYVERFPDAQALGLYGELLGQWAHFQPHYNEQALRIYHRAEELDPFNPLLALDIADVHLIRRDFAKAEDALEPFERLLTKEYPEFAHQYGELWAALAIARFQQGDVEAAESTLDKTRSGQCRFYIANRLIRPNVTEEQALTFICPTILQQLLTQES